MEFFIPEGNLKNILEQVPEQIKLGDIIGSE